jgi:hypothetical protein
MTDDGKAAVAFTGAAKALDFGDGLLTCRSIGLLLIQLAGGTRPSEDIAMAF